MSGSIGWRKAVDLQLDFLRVKYFLACLYKNSLLGGVMTSKLQDLIVSAQELSPLEQMELIRAVSQSLVQHYRQGTSVSDFWQPQTVEEILEAQPVPPLKDISMLRADFWPEDESADDLIDYTYQQRAEDR
jgi:hypothetical protein